MADKRIAPNLYLRTPTKGAPTYIVRVMLDGKPVVRSLGPAEYLTPKGAMLEASRLIEKLQKGEEKIRKDRAPTFGEIVWVAFEGIKKLAEWKIHKGKTVSKSELQWRQTINDYMLPTLKDIPLDKITVQDVLKILEPMWKTKTETASRTRMRLEAILAWCITHGKFEGKNVALWRNNLDKFLPAKSKVHKVKHHEAPTQDEIKKVVAYLLSHPSPVSAAVLFGIATATRAQEFVQLEAEEIKGDTWIIPLDRCKTGGEPYRVPLSTLAKHALSMMNVKKGRVFKWKGETIAMDSPRQKLTIILGRHVTMHGCRSTFSDWCDINDVSERLSEKSVYHEYGSDTMQAYHRYDQLEQRRSLMQEWADYLEFS